MSETLVEVLGHINTPIDAVLSVLQGAGRLTAGEVCCLLQERGVEASLVEVSLLLLSLADADDFEVERVVCFELGGVDN